MNRLTSCWRWLFLAASAALTGCAAVPYSAPVAEPGTAQRAAAKPPMAERTPVPGAAAEYVVKPGDTLYSIALEKGVDYRDLARWNGLSDPTQISVGQALRLSAPAPAPQLAGAPQGVEVGVARGSGPVESRPLDASAIAKQGAGDGSVKTEPKALRLPYSSANLAMLSREAQGPQGQPAPATRAEPAPEPKPEAKPQAATAPAALRAPETQPLDPDARTLGFIWPARGRLVAEFSEPNNKGVDIAGKLGEPVYASASGRVMYTGTGIRGYGKLIVIKHENGFNSVYAHNKTILVKEGQTVSRGERIAELGESDAGTPMLHFEIRKSGKPVDPLKYLPGNKPSS